ncbi:FG-GAP repeat domain-containing protein [Limnoglobus roseus]|uniref:VCBS repeat-containing protein n=1 Tax=Limnoglobus roseus TaxID=2598579 RepID=A0A5C1ALG7_9BACT|nr:VCBS repeat-containing protein [Limnoglobus roseus]QEL18582.1 VCBS repeat-containing protein [Limnoglobus roseus]
MRRRSRSVLAVESLDNRLVPAVSLQFDYSLDANGFFADASRRTALEQAGAELVSRLDTDFAAIAPAGGNTWSLLLNNPSSGEQTEIKNPTVPADTIVVYVGAYNLDAAEAGEGGFGGYKAGGDSDWLNLVKTRGAAGFSLWGGSIAFDLDLNWNFSANAPARGQTDFYTVATHELGHLLGIGTAPQYFNLVSGNTFTGANATAANGGDPLRLSTDHSHLVQGTQDHGAEASLQPRIVSGKRYGFTNIDYAVLQDIGWTASETATSPPTATAPITSAAPAGWTTVTSDLVALSQPGGSVQLFRQNAANQLVPVGAVYSPFGETASAVRSAIADVTGDGNPDLVFAAGPGAGSQVRVIDGQTGAPVGGTFSAFESSYTGGLFVTAADVDRDGHADVVVTPDQGGGGRVVVFSFATGEPKVIANFFGIDDMQFRGGARVAAEDINGDGAADLIVGAGFGGGPRVAIFDGSTVATGTPKKFVNDFFAFSGPDLAGLRNGIYIAAGDLNGDGKAEVIFGGGPGGGPRITVLDGATLTQNPVAAVASPWANFFAFDAAQRGGVRPAVRDVDRDGRLDLVVGSGEQLPAAIRVYTAANGTPGNGLQAGYYTEPFGDTPIADGIYVG